jgi:hypothetical protein
MAGVIELGPGLSLPLDVVTETLVILAKRGSGKTYTAAKMVEGMLAVEQPVCVVDPLGVWWGLRSSADGKSPGLPVVIFGGEHADVPLEETAGRVIADVVVERRVPAVLDLSLLSKSAARRFMVDFMERLYHRNRDPLHLVIDEADLFAPQRTTGEGARLLGAVEDAVRRGRQRGLGLTLITQRPAVLNKDVLTQAEVLIALRMTGVRDVQAIDEWVRLHAEDEQAREVKASLPSLPVGTAWVWSPGWLGILQQVQVAQRVTFDSSATPKVGEVRVVPTRMADIDLAALGAEIQATVEREKEDDPKALRATVERLRRQLAAVEPVRIEVPVLTPEVVGYLQDVVNQMIEAVQPVLDVARTITDVLEQRVPDPALPAPPSKPVPAAPRPAPAPATDGARGLAKAERAILSVLAQHGTRSVTQVALLTGYSGKSGGFRNALSSLRTSGYIEGRGAVTATESGLAALGAYDPLPTGQALIDWWKAHQLGKAERAILDVLVAAYPQRVTVADIAEQSGYSQASGGFRNALSRLRTLDLASGRGDLILNSTLMGAA